MTTQDHKAKPGVAEARKRQSSRCQQAYEHWVKNPYLRLVDLGDKFAVDPDAVRYWVKVNGHKRPDGKGFRPAVSERQQKIIDTYNAAIKEGRDIGWAVTKVNAGSATRSVSKGDFSYYAVKNNLPELAPSPVKYLSSTKYG